MRNTNSLSNHKKQFYIFVFSFIAFFMCAITTSNAQETSISNHLNEQTFTVKGIVLNEIDNEPLPGTSILLKNSINGIETDINGNFEIKNVKNGDVISFNFLGFEKQDITFNQNTPFLKVYLKESSFELLGAVDTKTAYKAKRSFWQRVKSVF